MNRFWILFAVVFIGLSCHSLYVDLEHAKGLRTLALDYAILMIWCIELGRLLDERELEKKA